MLEFWAYKRNAERFETNKTIIILHNRKDFIKVYDLIGNKFYNDMLVIICIFIILNPLKLNAV